MWVCYFHTQMHPALLAKKYLPIDGTVLSSIHFSLEAIHLVHLSSSTVPDDDLFQIQMREDKISIEEGSKKAGSPSERHVTEAMTNYERI